MLPAGPVGQPRVEAAPLQVADDLGQGLLVGGVALAFPPRAGRLPGQVPGDGEAGEPLLPGGTGFAGGTLYMDILFSPTMGILPLGPMPAGGPGEDRPEG